MAWQSLWAPVGQLHVGDTGEVALQRADGPVARPFNGYALWTYLTTPFLLTLDGVSVRQIGAVEDHGQTWVGLQAEFPPDIASHSSLQEFYFGDDHLLRRHDYRVDVAGGFPAVQYIHDIVEAQGVKVPSKRRAYRADAGGNALLDQLMVSIDISDIRFAPFGV